MLFLFFICLKEGSAVALTIILTLKLPLFMSVTEIYRYILLNLLLPKWQQYRQKLGAHLDQYSST